MLAAVLDADNDKNIPLDMSKVPPPDLTIESSAGNFQHVWLFDKPMAPEVAKPLLEALHTAAGGKSDGGTKVLNHPWRLDGALNWPNKAKLARGRSPVPQPVKLHKESDTYTDNDAFQRALEPYIRTEAPSAAPESDAPAAEINLSEATQALLDETPVEGKRSERIMAAAGALRRYGPTFEQFVAILSASSVVKTKYADKRKARALESELKRLWDKTADNARKSAAEQFANVPGPQPMTGARGEILPADCDEALALGFVGQYANNLRYCEEMGRWLYWTGTHWRTDKTSAAYYCVRVYLREFAGKQALQDGRKTAAARTVAAVAHMTRSDPRIATVADAWDSDPWLLNTPGGTVDLRTGDIRPASPSDHMTKLVAVAPGGECPLWLTFLHRSLGGDAELIAFVQRALGYALTGVTEEHALFFPHGSGRNGKGVLLNTTRSILADYAGTAPIETFLASQHERHPTDLAGLAGKRLVVANEVPQGRYWDENKIKTLTGGDPIAARFMRQDFFEFKPQFKLWVVGNNKPRLRSVDEAMRGRMNLIPFTVTIPPAERDHKLPDKLRAEWPGILAWLIEGCLAWQRNGLQAPATVRAATDSYMSSVDATGTWLDDCCVQGPDAWATRDTLYSSWTAWATRAGERVGSRAEFLEALRNRFEEAGRKGVRGFRGVELKPPPAAPSWPGQTQ